MKMKLIMGAMLLFGSWVSVAGAYQVQGFSQYQETEQGIQFVCQGQCLVLLNLKDAIDIITLDGLVQGQGTIGYSYIFGEHSAPGDATQINGEADLDKLFILAASQVYDQIPANAQIVLVIQGNLQSNGLRLRAEVPGFVEGVGIAWKQFWTIEPYMPYTINLMRGPKIGSGSANRLFYWLFILGVIVFLAIRHSNSNRNRRQINVGHAVFVLALVLWAIMDFRMGLETNKHATDDYKNYITQEVPNKVFRNRFGFHSFVPRVKEQAQGIIEDYEEIGFLTDISWPFKGSMEYYMYPMRVVHDDATKKITVFFHSNKVQVQGEEVFVNGVNIEPGRVIYFSPQAFIHIKNQ